MTHSSSPARTLNFAACSDRGLVRANNEDSAYAGPRLLALADGMGGHAAGEVASQFLIDSLRPLDSPLIDEPSHHERLGTLLATAMEDGNNQIAAHVEENPTLEGMGCTLSALLFRGEEVCVCHVGDSRGYLLRDGELTQITKDDTFVQSLVDEGKLDPEDVSSHPQRSLILKALNGRPVEPTINYRSAQIGDRYLLCSDGLSDPVSFDTIREILSIDSPKKAARRLVEMALRGGGPDNVTVVVADVVEFDPETNRAVDENITLPATEVLAGAIAGETEEMPRPNSPASRAASVQVVNAKPRNGASTKKSEPDPSEARAQARKKNKRFPFVTVIGILLVLALLGIGGLLGYNKIRDNYFVAEDGDQIVVNNGADATILGISLKNRYHDVCLDEDAAVRLLPANSDDSCHRFNTADLTPAARGVLASLPEGNYDEVSQQVQRLAEQTLPVCVKRDSNRKPPEANSSSPADKNKASESTSASESTKPTANNKPSDSRNAAENSDLTTPGVSCREVK
ncbi:PP2C family serine/threonine-protein phosphatase [Corynebacterium auriscanis]|uniref:PP2C family protein-serine/threonine phosphatase n=1 Tax=Corynebacterium auriscanis TaxID=99807 RepID=UPI003CE7C3C3